jgi:hypothetical protein
VYIKLRKSYNSNIRKEYERLSRMKNDYAVQIYYEGHYPIKRFKKDGKWVRTGGEDVATVADILQNVGVKTKPKYTGKPGRPKSVKRWPWEKQVRSANFKTWRDYVRRGIADQIVSGNLRGIRNGYVNLGRMVVDQIYEKIAEIQSPPLEPYTIALKGHSKPLIDSTRLINSIRYRIVPASSLSS